MRKVGRKGQTDGQREGRREGEGKERGRSEGGRDPKPCTSVFSRRPFIELAIFFCFCFNGHDCLWKVFFGVEFVENHVRFAIKLVLQCSSTCCIKKHMLP